MTDFEFYPNLYFEQAIRELENWHPVFDLAGRPTFDITKKPRIKTQIEWQSYAGVLVTVLTIGRREGWLELHQDGAGRTLYWRLVSPK